MRQKNSRLPSPIRMLTSARAIWLPSISPELTAMNATTASSSNAGFAPHAASRGDHRRRRNGRGGRHSHAEQQHALGEVLRSDRVILVQETHQYEFLPDEADHRGDLRDAKPCREQRRMHRETWSAPPAKTSQTQDRRCQPSAGWSRRLRGSRRVARAGGCDSIMRDAASAPFSIRGYKRRNARSRKARLLRGSAAI